ncbi:MAG: uncharacterized protein QOK40_1857 [Miltoncostaeaceae bacterium]|nr:uncharacterized protein [Miltoncostaeaceae bacterium]
MEITSYDHGVPSWIDIGVPDIAKAADFYGRLFGWEAPEGSPETGGYRNAVLNGHPVAGLGPQQNLDMPPYWTSYVNVDRADDVAAKVTAAGGATIVAPMDVMEFGRMAIFTDPTGAAFGVWQPGTHKGAEVVNEPGAWAFDDLQTADPAAAAPFYEALLGWQITEIAGADGAYFSIAHEGRTIGGLMKAQRPIAQPFWTVYIGTADVDASLERVAAAGGTVLMGATAVPAGRFAVALDDQGATLCLVEADFDD